MMLYCSECCNKDLLPIEMLFLQVTSCPKVCSGIALQLLGHKINTSVCVQHTLVGVCLEAPSQHGNCHDGDTTFMEA